MRKEHTIFETVGMYSSEELDRYIEEEKQYRLEEDGDDLTDSAVMDIIYDQTNITFDDVRLNLDKELDGKILAIASLGLWNGRKTGYKILGTNLKEVVASFDCDDFRVFTDGYNVKFEGHHHDGSSYVTFRLIKNMDNIQNLLDDIYSGKEISNSKLNYYTSSLVKEVNKV